MSARPVPPRAAAWFLDRALPIGDREPMLGDLEERFPTNLRLALSHRHVWSHPQLTPPH